MSRRSRQTEQRDPTCTSERPPSQRSLCSERCPPPTPTRRRLRYPGPSTTSNHQRRTCPSHKNKPLWKLRARFAGVIHTQAHHTHTRARIDAARTTFIRTNKTTRTTNLQANFCHVCVLRVCVLPATAVEDRSQIAQTHSRRHAHRSTSRQPAHVMHARTRQSNATPQMSTFIVQ